MYFLYFGPNLSSELRLAKSNVNDRLDTQKWNIQRNTKKTKKLKILKKIKLIRNNQETKGLRVDLKMTKKL